jgi:hypothetical protein
VQTVLIGGPLAREKLKAALLPAEPRPLLQTETEALFDIFAAIGVAWGNALHGSLGLRSSWLEFLKQKTTQRPSYIAEYVNAIEVMAELKSLYGAEAFTKLFFANGIPQAGSADRAQLRLDSRLAHLKHYVVDEFIRVQVVAGGFKQFAQPHQGAEHPDHIINYNGFIAGSRFNRIIPARAYIDPEEDV